MNKQNKLNDTSISCNSCEQTTTVESDENQNDLPEGWAQEFCRAEPGSVSKNRVLCPECNQSSAMKSGTVRFVS